jgi:hypothetical protein
MEIQRRLENGILTEIGAKGMIELAGELAHHIRHHPHWS